MTFDEVLSFKVENNNYILLKLKLCVNMYIIKLYSNF